MDAVKCEWTCKSEVQPFVSILVNNHGFKELFPLYLSYTLKSGMTGENKSNVGDAL